MKSILKVSLLCFCAFLVSNWISMNLVSAGDVPALSLEAALKQAQEKSNLVEIANLTLEEARLAYDEAKANQMARPSAITMQQAENSWMTAVRNRELARVELDMQVEQTYYDVLRANMASDLAKRSLDQAQAQLESTLARYNQGMVSEVDLLAAQMQVASAEAELNRARSAQISVNMRFNRIIGRNLDAAVELVDEFVYEPIMVNLENALEQAVKTRLELQQSRNLVNLRKKELDINDSPYSPMLIKQKSQVAFRKAEMEYAEKEIDILFEVRQSYNALKEAEQRIPIQQRNVDKAKESLRISQVRYEVGVISSLDLIEAQKSLFQAESLLIQALFDYNTQLARFYRTSGLSNRKPLVG